jgi:hypothetical protein
MPLASKHAPLRCTAEHAEKIGNMISPTPVHFDVAEKKVRKPRVIR